MTNSHAIITSYSPFRPFTSGQETGLYVSDPENSELTYEKKHELNLGADMGFLDNRINFSIDWYKRNTRSRRFYLQICQYSFHEITWYRVHHLK